MCPRLVRERREALRALADLSAAAHVSSLRSTMTGPACSPRSSSDAPVCASLPPQSPVLSRRVTDNHQRRSLSSDTATVPTAATPPTHRLRTGCLACEACVDTCRWGLTSCLHTWERLPESARRQRLWTASSHENLGWSPIGGRGGTREPTV